MLFLQKSSASRELSPVGEQLNQNFDSTAKIEECKRQESLKAVRAALLPLPALLLLLSLCATPSLSDNSGDKIRMLRSQALEFQLQGNTKDALDSYDKALKTARDSYGSTAPFLAEIYYDMGSLCLSGSEFKKAEFYLLETLKLNPNSSPAHLKLSELMILQNRPQEAARQSALVLARQGNDVAARESLALAYDKCGKSLRAYREYTAIGQQLDGSRNRSTLRPVAFTTTLPEKSSSGIPKSPTSAAKKEGGTDKFVKKTEEQLLRTVEAQKKAEQERRKNEQEQKKADRKKAEQDSKKAEQDRKRAEQDRKKRDKSPKRPEAKENNKHGSAEIKSAQASDTRLNGQAVLLTPVGKKPPASPKPAEEQDNVEAGKPQETKSPVPTKAAKAPAPKPELKSPIAPRPGRHAAGLVPPPPPVVPTFPIVPVVQPPAPIPKPKPPMPKKLEEKPREQPSGKEPEKGEDDDFLLEWGGAKGKKK